MIILTPLQEKTLSVHRECRGSGSDAPVLHPTNREEAVEVVNLELRVLRHESVHSLIVVNGVPRADELIRPTDVVDQLPVVGCACKSRNVGVDSLW